ncbi:hypothetical protein C1H46_043599 [Malus baccata]|uniref:RIN4 pathogenic type III effector avirulence factor Avr cleavage site domain-containing protein n=1 Tax=Malus baccata TaxID=106549 RepID=A0A540K9F8_MALBA|nr:hypothetical protein C1H46_043599 [Malus baccata]
MAFVLSFLIKLPPPNHQVGQILLSSIMASQDKGRPLLKFRNWDVNYPTSAEGFTVIFNKVRVDKKASTTHLHSRSSAAALHRHPASQTQSSQNSAFSAALRRLTKNMGER